MARRKIPQDAFTFYLSLGRERSYQRVAEHYGATKRAVAMVAARERWQERAAELERKAQEKVNEKAQESIEEMNERHLKLARVVQAKALEALKRYPLETALQAVRGGARLIATNPDRTCPTEDGEIPDCAGMIAAVEAVTGAQVDIIVGKPSPIILEVALERLGVTASECVIVGDRLETDIVMGKQHGLATALVLSGITRAGDPRIAEIGPDAVLPSIRELIT